MGCIGILMRRSAVQQDGFDRRWRTLARERGLTIEWRSVDGPAATVVAQHARYADLCILGREGADVNSVDYTFSEEPLFVTGRPVLFIPSVPLGKALGRHIAVAWNSSRPAARAVNDAMPLIEQTERTTVLTVNPEVIHRHGALPVDQIVEHLRRHGASVDMVRLEHIPARAIAEGPKPTISVPSFSSPARSAIQDFGKNCWAGSPVICSTG
jgi:hypothetical protein